MRARLREVLPALAVLVMLVALLLLTGCDPGRGPRDNRPPGHPPNDDPPAVVPVIYDVYFVVEVSGPAPGYRPYIREVTITETAIQRDGQYAIRIDPLTGQETRGEFKFIGTTPARRGLTLGAGVVMGSITAVYLGQSGDRLSCYVERDGVELPASRDEVRIPYTPTARGGAEVKCVHFAVQ